MDELLWSNRARAGSEIDVKAQRLIKKRRLISVSSIMENPEIVPDLTGNIPRSSLRYYVYYSRLQVFDIYIYCGDMPA